MPRQNFSTKRIAARQEKFVNALAIGEFAGEFSLKWIGPDRFLYIPDPANPFHYIRPLKDGTEEIIQPNEMETDGGSIPLAAQILSGRTPWEYGPAYMLHDWEFLRHDIDSDFTKSFEDVNLTLVEAIWTLMNKGYKRYPKPQRHYRNVYTIYSGVMGQIARTIWDEKE